MNEIKQAQWEDRDPKTLVAKVIAENGVVAGTLVREMLGKRIVVICGGLGLKIGDKMILTPFKG